MALDRGTLLVPQEVVMTEDDAKEPFEMKTIKKTLDFEMDEKEAKQASTDPAVDREHMCVYLRVRPLSEDEKNKGEDQVLWDFSCVLF